MSEPVLEIAGLTKRFGGLTALDDVSCRIDEGQLVGLVGPNGSGKTTLVNLINGYLAPDAGEIHLDGERVTGAKPNRMARRGLARMFQVTRVYPKLTVMENMLSVAYAAGRIPAREIRAAAEAELERVDLIHMRAEHAGSLSGGQRRLLEFALCFMVRPRLVLMDEPFASVHPQLKSVLDAGMQQHNAAGVAVVLVSHDVASVTATCERMLVLAAGGLLADGPAREVPKDERVIEAYLGAPLEE